ncbi:PAS domain S-box protein [Natronolimnobius sp. AArcel1]|uniref:PAS domain S-box protein n=1 Tax=Natronolimnobius sp. AArcel1 TaxID=1679093 RepID=UPI0013E9C244|nr:PAS domain S-box protein [Natronolimnobius sp. AArcel1]
MSDDEPGRPSESGDGDGDTADELAGDEVASPLEPHDNDGFFRRLVANTSEGVLTIDENSTIVFANPAIEELLGYAPEELIGSSKLSLIPKRLRPAHAAGLEKYLRTGNKHINWDGIELPALHKDGHEVPVLVSLREHPDTADKRLFTGLFRDISEQKLRERRFEAVFNNTYQFTSLLEPDGTLIEANETALSFAGLERDEIVGTPLWEAVWFQSNERAQQIVQEGVKRAANGGSIRDEIRVQGNDRTAIIDFSIRPVTDHHGDIRWLLPEGRDITGLKNREQHLQVLHRILRHNLRNDLTVIGGFAETLERELEGEHLEYAAHIVATVEELAELNERAKELADATLQNEATTRPVALWPALAAVAEDLQAAHPQSQLILPDAVDTQVAADDRLETVFREVLENALEHTDAPEPIVKLEVDDSGPVTVHVVDNGPGIPETEQTGVFNERPVTQVDHGSGLGLWLVELILEDYGGSLEYTACADHGGRVTISLPRASE